MNSDDPFQFPASDLPLMDAEAAMDLLISHSANIKASDLFLHTDETSTEIAVRQLGTVRRLAVVSPEQGRQLITYVKVMAGMNISEHRRPMDGRWIRHFDDMRLDMRINTIATLFGEDMTLRVWDRNVGIRSINELGMLPNDIGKLHSMLASPSGLILVTGPTGTGKTTTLYACLEHLNDGTRKISTLEDPVEYALKGVRQAQTQAKLGLDFPELLRNVLRQSPDVIMVGEIRDQETAATAIRAANSGHLVLATLHAPVAAAAVQSMFALGSNPFFLSSCLLGIVAQRLVRKLCDHCKVAYDVTEAPETFAPVRELLKTGEGNAIYGPSGCDKCHGLGYSSLTGLFELMTLNQQIRKLIATARPKEEIEKAAIAASMLEFRRSALLCVAMGDTSAEEIVRDLPPEHLGLED
ncbi:GspE/PulE family protein [Lignipirellula cremea]|uniref:Type II secretion system protein E n=1 Tax=Lignipirellula cremea TaxID=2528010 RepID=A0A518DU56_9BACT|nr:GspE/PulE family protein [Lignipirellula cremea]QDU95365.1 Type II secretion system protein E [Lignipirellula cremea]